MKKLLLFAFFTGGSLLLCLGQTNSNIVPASNLQSQKTPAARQNQPFSEVNSSTEKNTSNDPTKSIMDEPETKSKLQVEENGNRYLEYKVDESSNPFTTVENQKDDQNIMLPIPAEGYTDPNYESNKQKSEELIKQLEAPAVAIKTNEELILDLQTKINAIKNGEILGPDMATKLPLYEKELQLLLNTKQTKSCVSE